MKSMALGGAQRARVFVNLLLALAFAALAFEWQR